MNRLDVHERPQLLSESVRRWWRDLVAMVVITVVLVLVTATALWIGPWHAGQ